jgi:crotonobetainyl-CoA:carnitine CoA-transferase CaiB-like acyl-CoA transferase
VNKEESMVLKGVRILDLSQIMAGPYGTLLLADLGAEVIKIENPEGGDLSRAILHYTHKGESAYYLSFNRNKKSMTLNLRTDQAREIFYQLVKISDVVYENFRSGTSEKLKIDYETLKRMNPKIICCSVTGFGSNSPYKDRPALDLLIQAMGGVMSFTGEPGRPPVRLGYPMGDLGGGMFAAMAVLAALYDREKTGEGQRLDIAMLDAQISLMTYRAQYYFLEKVIPEPIGSGHVSAVPIRAFEARDGKYLTIDAAQEKFFQGVCEALGIPEVGKDPRFSIRNARFKNRDALMPILEEKFLEKDRDEWLDLLIKADVPAGPVNNLAEALSDPSVLARNMAVPVNHLGEEIKMVGNPIKMSKVKEEVFKGAPTLGQHNQEILSRLLGYSREQIDELRKNKIL